MLQVVNNRNKNQTFHHTKQGQWPGLVNQNKQLRKANLN